MKKVMLALFLCFSLFVTAVPAWASDYVLPTVVDENYGIRPLVPGANLYGGTNGLAFDSSDKLYVGSVAGVSIFNVDTNTGKSSVYLGAPNGGADDIVFGPDGRMYWTAFFLGKVMAMEADGTIVTLAENMPGANALDFNENGELYATQVFFGDALWQIDTTGKKDNKKIAEGLGGLNGFDFGSDGYIYGPLWFKHQVVKVDPKTGTVVKVVADGFTTPCAVNFDSKGNLYALDTGTGEIFHIDAANGKKTVVAVQDAHLDNLAFDSKDRMYITNMNYNGVYEVDVATGKIRTVTEDKLCYPQGIAVSTDKSGDTLYIADNFAYKKVDGFTGEVECPNNGARFVYTSSISEDGNHIVMSGWSDNWIQVYDKATDKLEYKITGIPKPTGCYMLADKSLLVLEGVSGRLIKITHKDNAKASNQIAYLNSLVSSGDNGQKEWAKSQLSSLNPAPAATDTSEVIATGMDNPTFMAPSGSGDPFVYVTEYSSGKITRINYKTGEKKLVCSGLKGPEGIAVNTDGHLLVVDSELKSLIDINPSTGATKTIVNNLPIGLKGASVGGPAASPLSSVTVSSSGTIYITSPMANEIYKIYKK